MSAASPSRAFLAPEVIQLSMMDCGPASLKCVLDGHGVRVGYGRLRDACSTSVDGTSIDTLEEVAVELGLAAEQVMVPVDHLLRDEARVAPAILVVRRPHAPVHFVVLWRLVGPFAQIMDPGVGRRWVSKADLLRDVFVHTMPVAADEWRAWAEGDAFLVPLVGRLASLGIGRGPVDRALSDPTWRTLGTLDAATRMLESLARAGAFDGRGAAQGLLERLLVEGPSSPNLPEGFWTVRPGPPGDDGGEILLQRGAVLLHVEGRSPSDAPQRPTDVSSEVVAALKAPLETAWAPFTRAVRGIGLPLLALAIFSVAASAVATAVQAVLLRSVLDIGYWLGIGTHRLGAVAVAAVFFGASLLFAVPSTSLIAAMGRRLELSLRVDFERKLPRIADNYFHSRLLSDVAERMHAITAVRSLPSLLAALTQSLASLVITAAAILWLAPRLAPWVVATVIVAPIASFVAMAAVGEREMRARSHASSLARFYLDSLLGIAAIRAHDAGPAMMREQEAQLTRWSDATRRVAAASVAVDGAQALVGALLAIGTVASQLRSEGTTGSLLLVTYWALQLPVLSQAMVSSARQLGPIKNALARVMELLDAPEETSGAAAPLDPPPRTPVRPAPPQPHARPTAALARAGAAGLAPRRNEGVRVDLDRVSVRAGGHVVLEDVDLHVAAGDEIAIVGASGAGKSTLLGLLLGWYQPATGRVRVGGRPLDATSLPDCRRRTAWLDPTVHLYNRRLVQNLLYGSDESIGDIAEVIEAADLRDVLEKLPEGLQTVMGEGGALVSGGEGQRVRLGRALLRRDAALVLLDEPFRGLDRDKRKVLLNRVRRAFAGATILCVTHDVSHTLDFGRVLVVEGGRVVEDGDPRALACDMASRYQAMLTSEQFVLESLWSSPAWRRFRVEEGVVVEQAARDYIDLPALVSGSDEGGLDGG